MAIVYFSEEGFVLDMEQLMRTFLRDTRVPGSADLPKDGSDIILDAADRDTTHVQPMQFKPDMYYLKLPFMMDSEFNARQRDITSGGSSDAGRTEVLGTPRLDDPENRPEDTAIASDCVKTVGNVATISKRKRTRRRREAELSKEDQHVQSVTSKMVSALPDYFTKLIPDDIDNNLSYRAVSKEISSIENPELVTGQCYENLLPYPTTVNYGSERYFIPSNCRYFSSDFSDINCLTKDGTHYDFFVVDPPWENKSAKRLKKYDYLPEEELLKIPLRELSREGALVALWVTNNERMKNFVNEQLLPAWGAVKEAEWTWVKVTRSGEPVYSFSSHHKKPYEKLLFARLGQRRDGMETVPDGMVVVSVPSAIHSHKPSLYEIAKLYLPEGAESLEFFARSLTPGWTSWGLEVLKLQNTRLYEPSEV